jgi:predicted transcriptional regulator
MSFYSEAAIRYKYLKEMEEQVIAVLKVERENKKAIAHIPVW